ncbi:head-tail connector protein [Tateyamaria omphalii]|uniref:head-tail connector protein n=1 Tax=Tateyamaria omphalii TaxID=299262 RepID=UPI001C996484|nr:head-tail connector protein [Tateyamaria omphalii]MBY5932968.1 head-tail connector protein [Tateyamaria omphalii]
MMLNEVTTVPDGALPVEEFKAHLRLGSGFGNDSVQDAVLISFLRAAVTAIEARTGKVLIARDFVLSVTSLSAPDAVALPVAPVVAVTAAALVDRAGVEAPVSGDAHWLERDAHRPRVRSVGAALPTIPAAGALIVSFTAGYGAVWSEVPADLAQAVMLLAAHYYEFRNETSLSEGCMPFGVTSLIERYKPIRLGGGVR